MRQIEAEPEHGGPTLITMKLAKRACWSRSGLVLLISSVPVATARISMAMVKLPTIARSKVLNFPTPGEAYTVAVLNGRIMLRRV